MFVQEQEQRVGQMIEVPGGRGLCEERRQVAVDCGEIDPPLLITGLWICRLWMIRR